MPRFTKETAAIAGRKSAAKLTPQQHSIRASEMGNTTLLRYGADYFSNISKLRKKKP